MMAVWVPIVITPIGGHGPEIKEKSSIAMSPVKLLPVIPSNVICNSSKEIN